MNYMQEGTAGANDVKSTRSFEGGTLKDIEEDASHLEEGR